MRFSCVFIIISDNRIDLIKMYIPQLSFYAVDAFRVRRNRIFLRVFYITFYVTEFEENKSDRTMYECMNW